MNTNQTYHNQYFSILGDSISTLYRHSTPADAEFYTYSNCLETGVFIPADTWWGQVIDRLEGKLLVNNSFSGSTVCFHPEYEIPSYACSEERTSGLDKHDQTPDVIMVFMGTNDWGRGTPITSQIQNDLSCFSYAYQSMLDRLKNRYPSAEIWCLTLPVSDPAKHADGNFPYCYGGIHIREYCQSIMDCASKAGARVIDLYNHAEPYDTVDGFHPTAQGMQTLAAAILEQLRKE